MEQMYKLLEYNLIEEAGKSEAPGRPNTYKSNITLFENFWNCIIRRITRITKI